jgi:hypothetical protein
MANLLIAVGGTGQHVALAVSRLVFIGALPRPLELAVIDADDNEVLSTSLRTFGNTVKSPYTRHPLDNFESFNSPVKKTANTQVQFHELFPGHDPKSPERDLFDLFFEESSATVRVSDGMFGRPSVGATIFAYNRESQLMPVFEKSRLANDIFIAGSMVGGTGAGIIHQLVKSLPPKKKKYGLIFLRWFRSPSEDEAQTISDDTMGRNMRYGLQYFFDETKSLLQSSLLIGAPARFPKEIEEIVVQKGKNDEKFHYFHLLAGYGVLQLPAIAVQAEGAVYASSFTSLDQMYEEVWNEGHTLAWYANRASFVKEILDFAASRDFQKELADAFKGFMPNKPKDVGRGLYEAIKQYEPQHITAINEITETWRWIAQQYAFSLNWLEAILNPLPPRLLDKRLEKLREKRSNKVKKIQTVWDKYIPMGQELPTYHSLAHQFHEMLVNSYSIEE